jgi:hypothetical protein
MKSTRRAPGVQRTTLGLAGPQVQPSKENASRRTWGPATRVPGRVRDWYPELHLALVPPPSPRAFDNRFHDSVMALEEGILLPEYTPGGASVVHRFLMGLGKLILLESTAGGRAPRRGGRQYRLCHQPINAHQVQAARVIGFFVIRVAAWHYSTPWARRFRSPPRGAPKERNSAMHGGFAPARR